MNQYFRLNSYCFLQKGKENGCIYDLAHGRMILLNEEVYKLLELCEQNISLKDIPGVDEEFLYQLQDLDLGLFYERPVYIDKLELGVPVPIENSMPGNHEINTLFIELTTQCNFDCKFCKDGDDTLFRRTGCKRWPLTGELLTKEQWKNILLQASKLSCKHVVFIGGEPFLQEELLKQLCKYAYDCGIEKVSIYTNGAILNEEWIQFLKKYKIELCIQINGFHNETYKEITGQADIGSTVLEHIKQLAEENISYRIIYLVNRLNEKELEGTLQEYAKFTPVGKMSTEFIYPVPKNNFYSEKYVDMMYNKKDALSNMRLGVSSFCNARKYHNCYSYQLAITASGDVLPCIMSRKFTLGNAKEEDLASILRSKQYEYYRNLNKDHIEKCRDCAIKYGCFDCRALEASATEHVLGMQYCNL